MNIFWKDTIILLEQSKEWDEAIAILQKVIAEEPYNVDAYLFINYLLMDLLVEEEHPKGFNDKYYAHLAQHYFKESYKKFSDNPQYLFFTGITAVMSEWYFGIDEHMRDYMLQKAIDLNPQNLLYKWSQINENKDKKEAISYAHQILKPHSPIRKSLTSKGSLGKYLLDIMEHWSKRISENPYQKL